jgi:hypothetical protein
MAVACSGGGCWEEEEEGEVAQKGKVDKAPGPPPGSPAAAAAGGLQEVEDMLHEMLWLDDTAAAALGEGVAALEALAADAFGERGPAGTAIAAGAGFGVIGSAAAATPAATAAARDGDGIPGGEWASGPDEAALPGSFAVDYRDDFGDDMLGLPSSLTMHRGQKAPLLTSRLSLASAFKLSAGAAASALSEVAEGGDEGRGVDWHHKGALGSTADQMEVDHDEPSWPADSSFLRT